MNFGSKFNRVKQQADRLFLRGDRTDVVGELRYAEETAEELRLLSDAFSRSLEKKLNTHMVTEEKKHRKVPENQVAEILKDALKEVSQNQGEELAEKPLLKTTIEEIVAVEQILGKEVLDYEDQIEEEVLIPLYKLLKDDFPSISKQKKALKQAGQDVDAAKAKVRSSHTSISQPNKLENYKEELEEAENKLEQIKDSYACDLFAVLGKQREIARLSNLYLDIKVDHLQKSLQKLNSVLPAIRKIFEESTCSSMYGVPLYEHLRITQQEIAVPIQICVKRMIEFGMQEEGLLRMAGSSTKIKRMKGLFDAGLITVETTLEDYNRDYDIHVVSGSFKSYLRELPEPLLTHTKHDELIEAVRKPDHKEKLRHMWQVINALPMQNYNNLRYVIKFLAMLASHSNENKMTPNNIAIVMAPNLIGTQRECDNEIMALGRNMTLGNDYRVVVEQLIEYSDYFFKGEVDFGVNPRRVEPPPSPKTTSTVNANGTQFVRAGSHRRTGSSDFNVIAGMVPPESESPKQPHRMKKKPAPLPPQGKSVWGGDETIPQEPQSQSPEPTRSKTPPSTIANAFNNTLPSPAPRLHHTSSLKRPTGEPPKPPGGTGPPIKPPRPSPPVQPTDNQSDTKELKPPRPSPPNAKNPKGESRVDPMSTSLPPIGFENIEERKKEDTPHIDTVPNSALSESKDDGAEGQPPVIGFHIEGLSVKEKIRENELIQQSALEPASKGSSSGVPDLELRRNTGGVTDSQFRKSLEGVLKHQPQNHSRHLVKPTFGSDISAGENQVENKTPVQLPLFPVPALRTSRDTAVEKPEPAPRFDKPAVPEKPSAINRSAIALERPAVHERPVMVGSKVSSLSSSFTQGISRSKENLVDTGHSYTSTDSSNISKSDSAIDHDTSTSTLEKPSKPPKPVNVPRGSQGEIESTLSTSVKSQESGNSGEELEKEAETKSGCGSEDTKSGCGPQDAKSGCGPQDAKSGCGPQDAKSGCGPQDAKSGCGPQDTKSGCGRPEMKSDPKVGCGCSDIKSDSTDL